MRTDRIAVPGASIHFETRGRGPVLLIGESGEGDAGRSADLIDRLDDFTVVSYDRRGLSRSRLDDPEAAVTMADHVDDAHRLLAHVTDEPASMLGCSFGAVIGLQLAIAHPRQLSTLVAHEPVAPWLLPEPEQDLHRDELAEIQRLYRTCGLPAALEQIPRTLGIDPSRRDAEPDLTPHPMTERRVANFGFFIASDFTAVREDSADPRALRTTPVRVVPATGTTTPPTVFDHRCAVRLGELVGTEPVRFPGGHNGNTTHPRAYAARLRQVLAHAVDGRPVPSR